MKRAIVEHLQEPATKALTLGERTISLLGGWNGGMSEEEEVEMYISEFVEKCSLPRGGGGGGILSRS